MPDTWKRSLASYQYPVDLKRFKSASEHSEWFQFDLSRGDRENTAEFERHFREHCAEAVAPWLEVIFWKLYSQPQCRNGTTQRIATHFRDANVRPQHLLDLCNRYVQEPSREHFKSFSKYLGIGTDVIAVAATFPAFLRPEEFPMVDTRVAKWVNRFFLEHNSADPTGPQLTKSRYLGKKQKVLRMSDFAFMQTWTEWCRHMSRKLSLSTSVKWRPRDVEMAVFTAWSDKPHPLLNLTPLPASPFP